VQGLDSGDAPISSNNPGLPLFGTSVASI